MPAKHGYFLPEIIDPERICVQLWIPNEQYHLLAFWAQIEGLGSALNWGNDPAHTALDVAAVWREVYADARERYLSGESCMSEPTECCDDIVIRLDEQLKRFDRIISLLEGGMTAVISFNNGGGVRPPDEAGGDCAPDHFDHNGDDEDLSELAQRQKALCITAERYIKSVLLNVLVDMSAPAALIDWLLPQFPQTVPLELADLVIVYPSAFSGLEIFFDAIAGTLDMTALTCAMVEGLSGDKNNTFVNFRDCFNDFVPTTLMGEFVDLLKATNGVRSNYKAFNTALNKANDEDLDTYECPCETIFPPYPVLISVNPIGSFDPIGSAIDAVYTEIDRDLGIWRIEQNTLDPVKGRYIFQCRDEYGRCIDMQFTGNASYPTQATELYWRQECDNSYSNGAGGGHGQLKQLGQDRSTAFDTYYKVTLVP